MPLTELLNQIELVRQIGRVSRKRVGDVWVHEYAHGNWIVRDIADGGDQYTAAYSGGLLEYEAVNAVC